MSIESITCPNCGASLELKPGQDLVKCVWCNSSLQISAVGAKALVQSVIESPVPNDSAFRMTVEDVFAIRGRGTIVTGRIASGTLHLGDQINVHRGNTTRKAVVTAIEIYHKMLDQAKVGDIVGVLFKDLTGDDVQRGDEIEA